MGKQHNKEIKRRRRNSYLKRKRELSREDTVRASARAASGETDGKPATVKKKAVKKAPAKKKTAAKKAATKKTTAKKAAAKKKTAAKKAAATDQST